jgi:hypothetical protein
MYRFFVDIFPDIRGINRSIRIMNSSGCPGRKLPGFEEDWSTVSGGHDLVFPGESECHHSKNGIAFDWCRKLM